VNAPAAARDRRLLFVHAHPDDETIGTGATMAKYAADGAQVTLVTCTLGELGEILVPELANLAADRDGGLGEHRIGERSNAMQALGVTDARWLGGAGRWHDSGMMGEPTNDAPECFWQADLDEAVGELVAVVREVRPQVIVSYDENGGYGHPDHIQVHHVGRRAAELAGTPRVYAATVSKEYYLGMQDELRAAVPDGVEAPDPEAMDLGVPEATITTTVDVGSVLDRKRAAMAAHPSQIPAESFFLALDDGAFRRTFGLEWFIRLDDAVTPHEDWIFPAA
jgi:N-acetyl-1-D-myo-inositol-2-amino-2-deoxy-alpha-D-glucopyranoside deacetylase